MSNFPDSDWRELFAAAFEQATEPMLVLGPDGTPLAANNRFRGLRLGRDWLTRPQEERHATLRGLAADDAWASDFLERAFGDPPAAVDGSFVTKDGRHGSVAVRPLFAGDGRFLGRAIYGRDLSEEANKERAREESEARLLLAKGVAGIGSWDWDFASGNLTWSPELLAILGVSSENFAGRYEDFMARVHPDDRGTIEGSAERLLDLGHETNEHRVVRPDGSVRWVEGRARLCRDASGRHTGATGVMFDVTDRHVAEERLQAAAQLKDEILGLVSHELRTPLTTLLGNANALRRHGEYVPDEERADALRDIETGAMRLHEIVENMLVLARADAEADALMEPVLLQRVLPQLLQDDRFAGSQAIELDVDEELTPVLGHAGYLKQIVINLVSNAQKYAPGAPIEISAAPEDGRVLLCVSDRGPGVAPELADRIFSPFVRAPGEKRTHGLGLGLTVCRRLVEAQGGGLSLSPRPGGGTVFSVSLAAAALD